MAALDSRVARLCAMAPQSYWSQWNGTCEGWAASLIQWRESVVEGKSCSQELRECAGGIAPLLIGCDQVCAEDVGGGLGVAASTLGTRTCLTNVGPVCVTFPVLLAAAAAAYMLLMGARQ